MFQSTPAITGGRDAGGTLPGGWSAGFNPRPPLLAGETRLDAVGRPGPAV